MKKLALIALVVGLGIVFVSPASAFLRIVRWGQIRLWLFQLCAYVLRSGLLRTRVLRSCLLCALLWSCLLCAMRHEEDEKGQEVQVKVS